MPPSDRGGRSTAAAAAANAFGAGTFPITGGTGAYRGVRGSGSFANRGVAVGARSSNGACLAEDAPPTVN